MKLPAPGTQEVVALPSALSDTFTDLHSEMLVFTPRTMPDSGRYPLLLFLHGIGERGRDARMVAANGPPKVAPGRPDWPFLTVSPQCTVDEDGQGWWKEADLHVLQQWIRDTWPVDESRLYLTGLSMGGFGVWNYAVHHPDVFAAIAPVCGGGPSDRAAALKDLPVWTFHGADDEVVPLGMTRKMVDAVNGAGGSARFTVYPGVDHHSWEPAYDDPELVRWFLKSAK